MTQGRDGSAWALKLNGVASRLSLVAAVIAIAALVAGTAGTSYAKSKKKVTHTGMGTRLEDTVVVSNYGAVFGGNLETFAAGAGHSSRPEFWVRGDKTFLSSSSGAGGDAVSSQIDNEIAVAIPIDFFDLTGCGPFGQPASAPAYGTGLVELFSRTANGNSAAENIICSPNFAFGAPNITGVFYPQGVAFESPYDGVNPGTDIVAVANMFPEVDQDATICASLGLPTVSLGTVTEYDRWTLAAGVDNVPPFNNNPVSAINPFTSAPYIQNTTIGGCLTAMAGPAGVTFDDAGYLFVVNNAGFDNSAFYPPTVPRFVTVYPPGAAGDVFPTSLIGYLGVTAGDLNEPVAATVDASDNLFVTDGGETAINLDRECTASGAPFSCCTGKGKGTCAAIPPAIKIFNPFANFSTTDLLYVGELLGVIQGPHTKLKSPMGIALDAGDDALYVVNAQANSLEMFTEFPTTGGDIPPTLIIASPASKMNLPVGVALPAFTPTPAPTATPTSTPTFTPTETIAAVPTPAAILY